MDDILYDYLLCCTTFCMMRPLLGMNLKSRVSLSLRCWRCGERLVFVGVEMGSLAFGVWCLLLMLGDRVCVVGSRFPMTPHIWLSFAGKPWVEFAVDDNGTLDVSKIAKMAAATGLRGEYLTVGGVGIYDGMTIERVRSVLESTAGKERGSALPVDTILPPGPAARKVDNTLSIRKEIVEQRVQLCNVDELRGLLKTELKDGLRFPVTLDMWDSLPTNRDKLFKLAGPDEDCYKIVPLVNAIADPPMPAPLADTEDSFHFLWDTVIEGPLKFFFDGPWLAERNKSDEGSTTGTRPDKVVRFGFQFYALWRGEEKGTTTGGDPRNELTSKLDWTYKNLPFVMAYYARGTLVTFCALHPVVDPHGRSINKCHDLIQFNIYRAEDRLKLVLACIPLAKLLKTMEDVCEGKSEVSDMPYIRRSSGKIIRPFGRKVDKTYPNEAFYKKVTAIYDATFSCPNVERLVHRRDVDRTIVVQKAVVAKPRNQDELIACLRCLCEALEWLHRHGFMHRDIRWENVLRDRDNVEKWVLVDLDEAMKSDQCFELHPLDAKSHAPEMTVGPHDTAVDIWGIGYLLSTSNIYLDAKLLELMERCLHQEPGQRPNATECLELLGA